MVEPYYENHHILPRSCGGDNSKENLVLFLPREHFEAHQLLVKMYKEKSQEWFKMSKALNHMINGNHMNGYLITSEEYEQCRILFSKTLQGENNPSKQSVVKEKISKKLKGRKQSKLALQHQREAQNRPETKAAKSKALTGKKRTSEQCALFSVISKARQTPEMKKRISDKMKGIKRGQDSDEVREHKRIAQNRPEVKEQKMCLRGRKQSEKHRLNKRIANQKPEAIEKNRLANSGIRNGNRHEVCVTNPVTGVILSFLTMNEASNILQIDRQMIRKYCQGKRIPKNGWIWKYVSR